MQLIFSYNFPNLRSFWKKLSAFRISNAILSKFFLLFISILFAKFSNSQIAVRNQAGSSAASGVTNIIVSLFVFSTFSARV